MAAKSPRNLRRHNAKVLCLDEIDGFEIGQEGDPIALATMRTLAFPDRKILTGSTPVFDYGPVSRLYAESDQRVFEIPCPDCQAFSEVTWAGIEWPEGNPEEAAWRCPACKALVAERHKAAAVEKGRWRATMPHVKGHAGFRINALVSPHANASWGILAAEFTRAKDSPATLQNFVNLVLGEAWREAQDDLDEHELAAKREPFGLPDRIPPEVLLISAGVDCQDDRLELVFLGHGKGDSVFVLSHHVIWGPVDSDLTWADLDSALKTIWRHPAGGILTCNACVIDSGDGGHADLVHGLPFY